MGVWKRLMVSVGLALLPLLGRSIPMPGVEFAPGVLATPSGTPTSVVALGIGPLLSGYLSVELAALVVPRWRRLRHSMPEGRRKLNRVVACLALVFAAFQAFGIAMLLEPAQLAIEVDRLVVVASLVAATAVLTLIAAQIERLAVVSGVAALWVVDAASALATPLPQLAIPSDALPLLALAGSVVLPVVATWFAVRASEPLRGAANRVLFSLPTSSLQPASAAAAVLALPSALRGFGSMGDSGAPLAQRGAGAFELEARIGVAVVLTVIFAAALQFPPTVRRVLAALRGDGTAPSITALWRSLALSLVPSAAFVVLLVGCDDVATKAGLPVPLAAVLVLTTSLALDAHRALQIQRATPDLICVAEERRPYVLPELLAAAENHGVSLRVTGFATMSMLRVFGPFAAARLLCPASSAETAREALTELFGRNAPGEAKASAMSRSDWNRAATIVTALGAVVSVLLIWMRMGHAPAASESSSGVHAGR